MSSIKLHKFFLLSLPYLVLGVLCVVLLAQASALCGGHFIYPLDDAYIHLSLVKQLSETGDWGLSPGQFHSSSSSPLFMLILYGARFLSKSDWMPVFINGLGAMLFLAAGQYFLHKLSYTKRFIAVFMVGIVLLGPIHLLVLSGMEHIWHGLFACLYVYYVWKFFSSKENNRSFSRRDLIYLCLSACLMTGFRYEGMFVVFASGLIFLWNRQVNLALFSSLSAAIPVVSYGAFSLSRGGYFFPNSLLIKGHVPQDSLAELVSVLYRGIEVLYENPFVLFSFLFLSAFLMVPNLSKATQQILKLIVISFAVHILFAEVGGYRYEAYLLLLSMLSSVLVLKEPGIKNLRKSWFSRFPGQKLWGFLFLGLCLFPFLVRTGFFTLNYSLSCKNIYEQQYQMASFLNKFYPTASVAANDIGAITYFTDIQLLDLFGIGSQEILELRREGKWDAEHVTTLAKQKQVEIAICYDSWVAEKLPKDWVRVASWTILDNFICGDEKVSFYGTNSASSATLLKNLQSFAPELPARVEVSYE